MPHLTSLVCRCRRGLDVGSGPAPGPMPPFPAGTLLDPGPDLLDRRQLVRAVDVDVQVRDAHALVDLEALPDVALGPAQGCQVEVLVGDGGGGFGSVARKEEVLDLLRLLLPAVPLEQVVVEVL